MKNLKALLTSITMFALMFFIIYLAGCFAQADMNIKNWSNDARSGVAVAGTILGFFAGAITFVALKTGELDN